MAPKFWFPLNKAGLFMTGTRNWFAFAFAAGLKLAPDCLLMISSKLICTNGDPLALFSIMVFGEAGFSSSFL